MCRWALGAGQALGARLGLQARHWARRQAQAGAGACSRSWGEQAGAGRALGGQADARACGRALGPRAYALSCGRELGQQARGARAGPVGCSCTQLSFQPGFSTRYFFPESPNEHCSL